MFKRTALVAVSALGIGVLSALPSNAADVPVEGPFRTASLVTSPATATIGTAVTAVVKVGSSCANDGAAAGGDTLQVFASYTTQIDSAPAGTNLAGNSIDIVNVAGTATVPAGYANTNSTTVRGASNAWNGYRNTVQASCTNADGPQTAYASISFTPDVAGTYVVVLLPLGSTSGAVTWTVVASAIGAVTAADSTSIINAGAAVAGVADATVSAARTASADTQAASIVVTAKNAAGTDRTAVTALTATISGPGTLGIGTVAGVAGIVATGRAVTGAAGSNVVAVFPDGSSGVATITISAGTTVLATETVTFYGAVASLSATVTKYSLADDAGATAFAVVSAKDAAGVAVPIAAGDGAAETTNGVFSDAAGDVAGTVNVLLDPAADTLGVKTTPWKYLPGGVDSGLSVDLSVVVADAVAAGTSAHVVTMTTDKSSYAPGEKITLTVSGKDASGNILADGAQGLFAAAPTSSTSLGGTLPVANPALVNGSKTYTLYAPLASGTVVIAGTSTSAAAETVSATFTVEGGALQSAAEAASDAAAEAIDAANAATDAANLAAEAADAATVAAEEARDAADAATAAVEELATQVATLMASLKAQITTLANTVAKIAKKVKA